MRFSGLRSVASGCAVGCASGRAFAFALGLAPGLALASGREPAPEPRSRPRRGPRTFLLRPGEGFAPSSYRLACSFGGRFWPRNRVLARGRSEKGDFVYCDQALCRQVSEVGGQKARNGAYSVPERGFVAIFEPFRCTSVLSDARTCGHVTYGHAAMHGRAGARTCGRAPAHGRGDRESMDGEGFRSAAGNPSLHCLRGSSAFGFVGWTPWL